MADNEHQNRPHTHFLLQLNCVTKTFDTLKKKKCVKQSCTIITKSRYSESRPLNAKVVPLWSDVEHVTNYGTGNTNTTTPSVLENAFNSHTGICSRSIMDSYSACDKFIVLWRANQASCDEQTSISTYSGRHSFKIVSTSVIQ
jgi:hypothetical protein